MFTSPRLRLKQENRVVCPYFDTLPKLRHSRFMHFIDASAAGYENNESPFGKRKNFKTDSQCTIIAELFLTSKFMLCQ